MRPGDCYRGQRVRIAAAPSRPWIVDAVLGERAELRAADKLSRCEVEIASLRPETPEEEHDRLVAGIRELGREHLPLTGWQQRVLEQADRIDAERRLPRWPRRVGLGMALTFTGIAVYGMVGLLRGTLVVDEGKLPLLYAFGCSGWIFAFAIVLIHQWRRL